MCFWKWIRWKDYKVQKNRNWESVSAKNEFFFSRGPTVPTSVPTFSDFYRCCELYTSMTPPPIVLASNTTRAARPHAGIHRRRVGDRTQLHISTHRAIPSASVAPSSPPPTAADCHPPQSAHLVAAVAGIGRTPTPSHLSLESKWHGHRAAAANAPPRLAPRVLEGVPLLRAARLPGLLLQGAHHLRHPPVAAAARRPTPSLIHR
jgi:hypothetical protein